MDWRDDSFALKHEDLILNFQNPYIFKKLSINDTHKSNIREVGARDSLGTDDQIVSWPAKRKVERV